MNTTMIDIDEYAKHSLQKEELERKNNKVEFIELKNQKFISKFNAYVTHNIMFKGEKQARFFKTENQYYLADPSKARMRGGWSSLEEAMEYVKKNISSELKYSFGW